MCAYEEACSVPGEELPEDEEGDDDWSGKVFLEEGCGVGGTVHGLRRAVLAVCIFSRMEGNARTYK